MKVQKKDKKKGQAKKTINQKSKKTQKKKINKKQAKVLAIIVLIIAVGVGITTLLLSDLFNITNVIVVNNKKVSTEEIITNSGLVVGNNMFKTFKSTSKNGIQSNPYIEKTHIRRKFNGEVIIDVTERTATYMLQKENEYAYINNQGYVLEISKSPLTLPIIKGYTTEELILGNRLNVKDLKKLDIIIQIMESAKSNKISDKISTINISDGDKFVLEIPSEGKTVQFGDGSNINVKILWIVDLISREKDIEGEIILDVPDIKEVYFREKV